MPAKHKPRSSRPNAAVKWIKVDVDRQYAKLDGKTVQVSRQTVRRGEHKFHGQVYVSGTNTMLAQVGPFDYMQEARDEVLKAAGIVVTPRAERTSVTIDGIKWERLAGLDAYVTTINDHALRIEKRTGDREPVMVKNATYASHYRTLPPYWAVEVNGRSRYGHHSTMKKAAEDAVTAARR